MAPTVVTVSSNQTWTCPAGCLYIDLYMKGGGAGGNWGGNYIGGTGGGEGGVVNESLYAVTPGVVYQCVVGTAGAKNGGGGGSAVFKDGNGNPLKTASGGTPNAVTSVNTQGATGQGTNGGVGGAGNYPTGNNGSDGTAGCGGGGGGASLGTAGQGGVGGAGLFTITYALPTADFSSDVQTGSKPLTVTWTNSSTDNGTTSYQWYYGDGNGSTSAAPGAYQYTTSGTFTVTLTASTAYGYNTKVRTNYITVYTSPFSCSFIIMSDRHRGV